MTVVLMTLVYDTPMDAIDDAYRTAKKTTLETHEKIRQRVVDV